MLRKSVVILAMLLSSLATQVFALGLGTVTVESALNQPLQVRIEILQLGSTRLQDITIQMASQDDFQRFNIERTGFLSNVGFTVAASPEGNFVTLTSTQIVREPYLSFILDTRWPNGRLLSEHTILLDLPVFQDQRPDAAVRQPISPVLQAPTTQTQQPAVSAPVVPAPVITPPVSAPAAPATAPDAPAAAPGPAAPPPATPPPATPTPAAPTPVEPSPVQPAPVEPTPVEPTPVEPTPEPDAVVEQAAAPVPAPQPEPPAPVAAEPETIETSAEDTLSDIALQVRPSDAVTMQQTMLAIQRLNPDAFTDGNINQMRSGQVLRVPDLAEIQSVDAREAAAEINRQNQEFSSTDLQPLAAPSTQTANQVAVPQGQLSVVTSDDGAIDANGGAGQLDTAENAELDQRIAELQNQLAVQQEEADRARIEREELQSRMDEMEQQIAAAQEIIRLQDIQLAQLQDSLTQAAEQQAALAATDAQVAAQTEDRTSLTGDVMRIITGNILFIGFGLALVVLLLVVLLLRRNRAKLDESDLDELNDDSFVSRESNADADDEENLQDFAEDDLDRELDKIVGVDANSDPVGQAAALLNKGNIALAISLLQSALDKSPDDQHIRFKLVEAYAAQGDLAAFEEQADIIGDDPEFNSKINTLRRSFKVKVREPKPADKPALQPVPKPGKAQFGKRPSTEEEDRIGAASFLDDLGIDLDAFDDDDDEPPIAASAPKPVAPAVPEKKPVTPPPTPVPSLDDDSFHPDDMDLTFDLVGDADDPAPAAAKPANKAAPAAEAKDAFADAKDFDLDDESGPSKADSLASVETLEFEIDDLQDTNKAGSSKMAEELDIESFEFNIDETPAAPVKSGKKPELELETFAFDTKDLNLDKPATPAAQVPDIDEENLLDFDFDKTEIQPVKTPKQAAVSTDDLETFDFDLDESPVATVVEKPVIAESDALDIDIDDFDLDDDTLDIEAAADTDTVIESREVVEVAIDIDFDFDDDIVEPATPAAAATDSLDDELDDLEFLSDADEVEIESVDDVHDVTELSAAEEVATKLELAYAYRKMGDVEGAREILEEVLKEGTPDQTKEANDLLAAIKND